MGDMDSLVPKVYYFMVLTLSFDAALLSSAWTTKLGLVFTISAISTISFLFTTLTITTSTTFSTAYTKEF